MTGVPPGRTDRADALASVGRALRIDLRTYEAFQAATPRATATPRIVRWFDCLARAGRDE